MECLHQRIELRRGSTLTRQFAAAERGGCYLHIRLCCKSSATASHCRCRFCNTKAAVYRDLPHTLWNNPTALDPHTITDVCNTTQGWPAVAAITLNSPVCTSLTQQYWMLLLSAPFTTLSRQHQYSTKTYPCEEHSCTSADSCVMHGCLPRISAEN